MSKHVRRILLRWGHSVISKYQEPITQWQSTRFQKQKVTNTKITKINTPNHTADSLLNWRAGDALKNSLSRRQGRFTTPNHWSSFVLCRRHSSRCLLWYRRQSNWNKTRLGYQLSHTVKYQTNQCLFSDLYPHHQETNEMDEDDFWNVHLLLFNHLIWMAAQERFTALWALSKFQGFNCLKWPSILCFVFIDTEVQVSWSHTSEITFFELTNNKACTLQF